MLSVAKTLVKRAIVRWLLWREGLRPERGRPYQGLAPPLWGCSVNAAGNLAIDGVDTALLAKTYGTPLHVVNRTWLLKTYRDFLGGFRDVYPNTVLATSYKTNPVPDVLAALHAAGSQAEVISHFELWLALRLGVPANDIIFNGPGKTPEAIELAVARGIRIINADSLDEVAQIAKIAEAKGVRQRVGLRVITSVGWSSQFGVRIRGGHAAEAFRAMRDSPALIPCGLHLHLGTGIKSIETYVQAVGELVQFADELKRDHGITIDDFDLGGGFGVPTVRTMSEWDLRMVALGYPTRLPAAAAEAAPSDYPAALAPLLRTIGASRGNGGSPPRVVLEPGRAITSASQVLLLSVLATKPGGDGTEHLIADGGKNITMPLGWETHQIFAANKMNESADTKSSIFGPLCHPGDILAKNLALPRLGRGDLLAVMDAGAYFVPNQMNFSNPRPAIVMVERGAHRLIRRREDFLDIVKLDAAAESWHAPSA